MSLPFYEHFGWEPEVVCVAEKYTDAALDHLLIESIPSKIKVHRVNALDKKLTSKLGLGSIALRSLNSYRKYVNNLLKNEKFDLIYFSTTQFPVMVLGNYWKKKFNVPYVIDMQDPWFSNYYQDKPKDQRPKKHWFSYRLNKYLEPRAIKNVDGLIAVSKAYITTLTNRYPEITRIPAAVIPFSASEVDFEIAKASALKFNLHFNKSDGNIHLLYIGRAGHDMSKAIELLFKAFRTGLEVQYEIFNKLRFYFIGTSYAKAGTGIKTIEPVARNYKLEKYVMEFTDRVPYYEGLYNLLNADALIIPGSDDPSYTASKIFPYILAAKPMLAIFKPSGSIKTILEECNAGMFADMDDVKNATHDIFNFLRDAATHRLNKGTINLDGFSKYSAKTMTENQCKLFDEVVRGSH
ncbi:MAG: hypothetical protein EOO96_00505 [Pedobacter sp.]|nr:MAG: hypothetical protein EOO96_00505 [Pedobacter sp.]